MKDLFVNFMGAVVFSVIGYFYVKNRGKGRFARRFIPRLKSKDADFLEQAEEEDARSEIVKSGNAKPESAVLPDGKLADQAADDPGGA